MELFYKTCLYLVLCGGGVITVFRQPVENKNVKDFSGLPLNFLHLLVKKYYLQNTVCNTSKNMVPVGLGNN